MPLWKLQPNARLHDPRWLDHHFRQPIVVEARDQAHARHKAAEWEHESAGEELRNGDAIHRSAFHDEKLYTVQPIDEDSYNPETQGALLETLYPVTETSNTMEQRK